MRLIRRTIEAATTAGYMLAALSLLYMVGHVLVELVLRTIFGRTTYVLNEFVGYGLLAMTFLSLAYCIRENRLIRIELVTQAFPGRVRRLLWLAGTLATMAVFGYVAAFAYRNTAREFGRGSVSETVAATPLWIPYAIMFAGLVAFVLRLALLAVDLASGEEPGAQDDHPELGTGE